MSFLKFEILLLVLLVQLAHSADLKYTQDPEALCLDGTPGSYYLQEGSGTGANKWIIFFQGGGWIGGSNVESTKNSAKSRSQGDLGSSKNMQPTANKGGMFSRSASANPEFYNWNYIYVNYCDGTGHQGYAKDPIVVGGTNIYFRGEKIVKSILTTHLAALQNAASVLVSGCSAGGLAAFTWTQYVRELLPQTVKVFSAPDSGIFLDYQTYDGSITYKNTYQMNFMQLANVEVDPPNAKCVADNQSEKWKCLFSQYLIKYTDTPIFFVQSPYDSWCIPNILKISCGNDGTLTKCDEKQRQFIENHFNVMRLVMDGRIEQSKVDGAFAPSCLQHCFLEGGNFNNGVFNVPGGSGNTISKTMQDWINNPNSTKDSHIDAVNWPNNQQCSRVTMDTFLAQEFEAQEFDA